MKKPIHKILVPISFYHFLLMLVIYFLIGMIAPTPATRYWLLPNLFVLFIEVFVIMISRLRDNEYVTLFKKRCCK